MHHKFKAFTLMEVLVVMMVSGILLAIAATALSFIENRYRKFNLSTSQTTILSQLQFLLIKDANKSNSIQLDRNYLIFHQDSLNIEYEFRNEYLLRKQINIIDTFYMEVGITKFYFLGKEVFDSQPLIDEIYFEGKLKNEIYLYHVQKEYDAKALMQHDNFLLNTNRN